MASPVLSPATVPVFHGLLTSVYVTEKLVPTTLIFITLLVGVAPPVASRRVSTFIVY